MADLDPLIRLRKHIVDEKQKILSTLYREAENLENKKKAMLDQVEHERRLIEDGSSPEASAHFGRYAENMRKKIAMMDDAIKKMEARIQVAQDDMRNAFAELKKVQITQRNREEKEKEALEKKESDLLDEMAIEGFRRKTED